MCAFCGNEIFFNSQTPSCEMCGSKNFLIENEFALLNVVAQGGFGRIFKAFHIPTNTVVAIKERKSENETFIQAWKKEIKSLRMIHELLPNLFTSRIIGVLNDTPRGLQDKYLVLEFIEGGDMKNFDPHKLKTCKFEKENDFIRMMLMLFEQLKTLHSVEIIHRDIKPGEIFYFFNFSQIFFQKTCVENIMFMESQKAVYFLFVDFGCAHKLKSGKKKVKIFSPGYSPPELNTDKENFKSDIFSLGNSFLQILDSCKIKISEPVVDLIKKMVEPELENRASIKYCMQTLSKKFLLTNKTDQFVLPKICEKYEIVVEFSKKISNKKIPNFNEISFATPFTTSLGSLKTENVTELLSQLEKKNILITEKEQVIKTKDKQLLEKDTQIKDLIELNSQKENSLKEFEKDLKSKQQQLEEFQKEIQKLQEQLHLTTTEKEN